jgi:UDP-2,4-diacetamido-2,4,6-trideoxy-beta-L-altropyranose hydrolase
MSIAPKAVVRVDGSLEIGGGHVRRCVVLAEALAAAGWSVTFACRPDTREAVPTLACSAFAQVLLAADRAGAEALCERIPDGCDLLVVDNYALDATFERACRGWAKLILVVDDLADRRHDCDVLVDQTPGRQGADYASLVPDDCIILAGSEYALLDVRFGLAHAHPRARTGDVKRVLVSFGCSDPAGMTALALEALGKARLGVAVDIVVGRESADFSRIRRLAADLEPPPEIHIAVDDMASLMDRADIAIGAGGVTALERCCLGLPSIVVTIAENQRMLAAELSRRGAVLHLGSIAEVTVQTLAGALRSLVADVSRRRAMSEVSTRVTDGLGASRVRVACYPAPVAKDRGRVGLRPATIADSALMLAWQSAPGIRAYSRDPKVPKPTQHGQWLHGKLADPNCIFNIVLHGDRPVGVLRFDRQAENLYEISILITAEAQNLGIGRAALELGKRLLPNSTIRAEIQPSNIASIRIFERAGYRRTDDAWMLAPGTLTPEIVLR